MSFGVAAALYALKRRVERASGPAKSNSDVTTTRTSCSRVLIKGPEQGVRFQLQLAYRGEIIVASVVTLYAKVFPIHVTTPFSPKPASTIERATFLGIRSGSYACPQSYCNTAAQLGPVGSFVLSTMPAILTSFDRLWVYSSGRESLSGRRFSRSLNMMKAFKAHSASNPKRLG
jgi:hypothetical protein